MKKSIALFLTTLMPFLGMSQQQSSSINGQPELHKVINQTLSAQPESDLTLQHLTQSAMGKHYTYQQRLQGKPIIGAILKVNTSFTGEFISSYSTLINLAEVTIKEASSMATPYWILKQNTLIPVSKSYQHYQVNYTNSTGEVVLSNDTRLFYTDTMVKARVFNPDPLTTAGVVYGQNGTYRNFNDSDYALLNNQRVWVNMPVQWDNGVFYLQNQYARIAEFAAPVYVPATSTTDTFDFTRKQIPFKEVMALYHISSLQSYLNSIGIFNTSSFQLMVDAHSSTADQSFFSYEPDTTLNFGLGGVPDAEDADVIIHEYTHALVFDMNPLGASIGKERRAMEEGICDAVSCAYSKRLNPFNWKNIFNWDGYNEYWDGRNGASTKTYLDKIDDYYSDSEIWSSTMNSITERIGPDASIKLLFALIPQLTPYTTMPQAARMMYDADSVINNGLYRWVLAEEFLKRKLGDFPSGLTETVQTYQGFEVLNSYGFAFHQQDLTIRSTNGSELNIEIYTLSGVFVGRKTGSTIIVRTDELNAGMYLLRVFNQNADTKLKLLK